MITDAGKGTATYLGLSTDVKPVGYGANYDSEPQNMSVYIEMDTGKIFYFNAPSHAWVEMQ